MPQYKIGFKTFKIFGIISYAFSLAFSPKARKKKRANGIEIGWLSKRGKFRERQTNHFIMFLKALSN
jgi:hypothetical protein